MRHVISHCFFQLEMLLLRSLIFFWILLFNTFEFSIGSGEVHSIQHYMIKFVSDLPQVGGFFPDYPVYSTNKTDNHDMSDISLNVSLITIAPSPRLSICIVICFILARHCCTIFLLLLLFVLIPIVN